MTATGRSAGAGRRPGFTVVEILLVLVLAAIIAAMAIPRLNYDRYRADAAMRTVKSILQSAQRNAIMRQTNIVVSFDETTNIMEIVEDANNNCVHDSGERVSQRKLEEGAQFKVPAVAKGAPVSNAVSGPNLCTMRGYPAIQFLRDGATSTDLDVYLTSAKAQPADHRLLHVIMASGRTESWRYDGAAWRRTN